jgi:hypothetical protein
MYRRNYRVLDDAVEGHGPNLARFGHLSDHPPDIVLIGDSHAQGCSWHGLGSGPLGAINLARRGTVIRQIDAVRMHPHTVIVAAGTNDLLVDHAPASRIEFDFAIL